MALGFSLRRTGRFPDTTAKALNTLAIHVSFPATVLLQITALFGHTHFGPHLLLPASMAWLLFTLSWLTFRWVGKRRGWSPARIGALTLTAGLGNTSFVGFPLLEALHGPLAVQWGVLVDQLGSFLVLSTLGIWVAGSLGRDPMGAGRSAWKSIVSFPPFLALLAALTLSALGVQLSGVAHEVIARLAATLVPLALFAVGFQLQLSPAVLKRYWRPLSLGLGFKMLLMPALMWLVYGLVLNDHSFVTRVIVLEAAMATMITAAVVANDFSLDGELANLMVGVSIPLSLITVPLWDRLLNLWF